MEWCLSHAGPEYCGKSTTAASGKATRRPVASAVGPSPSAYSMATTLPTAPLFNPKQTRACRRPGSLSKPRVRRPQAATWRTDLAATSLYSPYMPLALSFSVASSGPSWSTEKALWTRSSRLQAKAEALGSVGYKATVAVDD